MMFFQSTATVLILQILFKGFCAGTNIKYCSFSWGFAGNDCKNLIFPMNLALKRNWDPHLSVGALQDLHTSHSWFTGYLEGFISTYYFLPVTIMFIMKTHPFLLKLKSKTRVLCEEDIERWWVLIKQPALEILQIQAHAWTVPPFLVFMLSGRPWQKHTSQGKQRHYKPNIPTHKYLNLAWRVIFRKRLIVQIITILFVKTLNHKNQWCMCNILLLCVEINFFCNTNSFSLVLAHGERCWWVKFYPQKCICNTYRNHTQACKNKIWLRGQKMCLFKMLLNCGRRRDKIAFCLSKQERKKNDFAGSWTMRKHLVLKCGICIGRGAGAGINLH